MVGPRPRRRRPRSPRLRTSTGTPAHPSVIVSGSGFGTAWPTPDLTHPGRLRGRRHQLHVPRPRCCRSTTPSSRGLGGRATGDSPRVSPSTRGPTPRSWCPSVPSLRRFVGPLSQGGRPPGLGAGRGVVWGTALAGNRPKLSTVSVHRDGGRPVRDRHRQRVRCGTLRLCSTHAGHVCGRRHQLHVPERRAAGRRHDAEGGTAGVRETASGWLSWTPGAPPQVVLVVRSLLRDGDAGDRGRHRRRGGQRSRRVGHGPGCERAVDQARGGGVMGKRTWGVALLGGRGGGGHPAGELSGLRRVSSSSLARSAPTGRAQFAPLPALHRVPHDGGVAGLTSASSGENPPGRVTQGAGPGRLRGPDRQHGVGVHVVGPRSPPSPASSAPTAGSATSRPASLRPTSPSGLDADAQVMIEVLLRLRGR